MREKYGKLSRYDVGTVSPKYKSKEGNDLKKISNKKNCKRKTSSAFKLLTGT